MKCKFGHISNSSTTSFLVYGKCIDAYDYKDKIVELAKKYDCYSGPEDGDEVDPWELSEMIDTVADKVGLECHSGYDCEYLYLGISSTEIKDDETGAEFKKRVKMLVDEMFGGDNKCSYHEEAYRDG